MPSEFNCLLLTVNFLVMFKFVFFFFLAVIPNYFEAVVVYFLCLHAVT